MKSKSLFVYYGVADTPIKNVDFLCWSRVEESSNIRSLMTFIDSNKVECQKRFLDFIDGVKRALFNELKSDSPIDRLFKEQVWYLSRFSELSNHVKSKNFDIILKVLATELFCETKSYSSIKFIGFPKPIQDVLNVLVPNSEFINQKVISTNTLQFVRFKFLIIGKSFAYLLSLFARYFRSLLDKKEGESKKVSDCDVVIVDYLYDFNTDKSGEYRSRYWGELPDGMKKAGLKVAWLHIFVPHAKVPSIKLANTIVSSFNSFKLPSNKHYLWDDCLSFSGLCKAWILHIGCFIKSKKIRRQLKRGGDFPLWPLVEYDWVRSFESVENLKSLVFYNIANQILPKDLSASTVIYISENQPWEYSLVDIALKRGCTNIVASLQATVRYWDFRYLQSLQKPHTIDKSVLFAPHTIAANSLFSSKNLHNTPASIIKQVESYRMGSSQIEFVVDKKSLTRDIVIAGEYSDSHTLMLLSIICQLGVDFLSKFNVYYRPHPSSRLIIPNLYNSWLKRIPDNYDLISALLVITDANTSFAADCWEMGASVACFVEPSSLNMSPLYGQESITFFSHSKKLHELINYHMNSAREFNKPKPLFNTNKGSSKWLTIIGTKEFN
ncbi:hypothetical protein TW85_03440 [Marinomonas sp. S3726]|uniref:hypothetical protein n=1 Tax=Marinomonas sp. S3726 TaxID=579484 RepID=UPI0005F9F3D5|nr:hypothetical protein [Marinomonas sp. S3726]KJZ15949.1 hypothetical protein TW85_03440 [Marinomonas sp. S3726]